MAANANNASRQPLSRAWGSQSEVVLVPAEMVASEATHDPATLDGAGKM